jgi:holliday junction resolvase Hjr
MGVLHKWRKSKGSKAERELIHMLWKKGFAALRAAGSGSMQHPSPDIVASNGKISLAIECKTSHRLVKYIEKDDINQLDLFANLFGARPFVAVRFDNDQWYFVRIADMKVTPRSYAVNYEVAKKKGLSFEEMIGEYHQERLKPEDKEKDSEDKEKEEKTE